MDTGYSLVPKDLDQHIKTVPALAERLHAVAEPVAGLYPPGGASWTGTQGGAALLRTCLKEIADALRKTSTGVITYAARANECLNNYHDRDKAGAESISKCLIELPR